MVHQVTLGQQERLEQRALLAQPDREEDPEEREIAEDQEPAVLKDNVVYLVY